MSRTPGAKKRRLSPAEESDWISSTTIVDEAPERQGSDFLSRASRWNLEQDYEQKPRKGKKNGKESTRLPIKTAEGRIEQMVLPQNPDSDENSWLGSEEDVEADEKESDKGLDEPVTKVSIRRQILEAKEELARIASLINEDPEAHSGSFRTLSQMTSSPNITIKKLALATQLAVFKDVIPGYRIRPVAEDEMKEKLSKDVRQLRNFEQSLVTNYQGYVRELGILAKASRGTSSQEKASLASVAISCACTLILAVPHFNFRGELLKILVDKLSMKKVDDDFIKCRETLEILFRDDEDGTPSLDAVSLLSRMIKARNFSVNETVLNTFLHLRLLSDFSYKGSQNHIDKNEEQPKIRGKKMNEKRVFLTKKQRKLQKERKIIETEMKEADATVSHEERDRMQAETLKLVFVTYFRILKARSPSLMGAVLEGLAKYAHLINQDFFGDLLEALKDLIRHSELKDIPESDELDPEDDDSTTHRSPSRESLLCIITAFALLQGQDARSAATSLSLDLSFFITHLYGTLYALALNPDLELSRNSLHLPDPDDSAPTPTPSTSLINVQTTIVLLLRSLTAILLPPLAVRAVPPLRLAAFSKQLCTSSLHLPEKSCLAMLGLMEKVSKTHAGKISSMWNTEERKGDGVFDPLRGEVEGSNPFATTVWEGELLRNHFCPGVRERVLGVERNVGGKR